MQLLGIRFLLILECYCLGTEKYEIETGKKRITEFKKQDVLNRIKYNTFFQRLHVKYRCAKPIADLAKYIKDHGE